MKHNPPPNPRTTIGPKREVGVILMIAMCDALDTREVGHRSVGFFTCGEDAVSVRDGHGVCAKHAIEPSVKWGTS